MRVMLDSALTAGYLLVTDSSEREAYVSQSPSPDTLRSGTSDEIIAQAKTLKQPDCIPPHRLKSLNERIETVCSKTGTNPDAWRMLVASIYPETTDILTGSIHGYALRFRAMGAASSGEGSGGAFSMLFLMGCDVLYELIGFFAKHINTETWKSETEALYKQAYAVMQKSNVGIDNPVQGAWDRLERLEHFGARKLSPQLGEFEDAFRSSYEAAVIIPFLMKKDDRDKFKLAMLYLRRALNDFRAVWVLLTGGYTAQASACSGSLFEASLASICLLQKDSVHAFEAKLQSPTGNDFPWGPMEMAKMACALMDGLTVPSTEYEECWRSLYARYVWLSQIRHSTFQSVTHEIKAGTIDCGTYTIMSIPNCKDEDLPVKIGIALGALADLQAAMNAFLVALGHQKETGIELFDSRKVKAAARITELVHKFSEIKNPITIARTRFMMRHPPISKTKES